MAPCSGNRSIPTILRVWATCISYMSSQQSVIHINILLNCFKSALKRFLKSISCPYVMLCYCYVMLCYVMLSYVILCYVMFWLLQSTCKRIQDSPRPLLGIQITRYWIPDSQYQWKLDSRFQSLVAFPISWAVFRILLTRKNFLDSGNSIRPYMGRSYTLSNSHWRKVSVTLWHK